MSAHNEPPESYPPGREAPGDLELLRRFINTLNLESGADKLASPTDLDTWLVAHGRPASARRTTRSEWQRAVDVREAFRRLIDRSDPTAATTLNSIARRRPAVVHVGQDRVTSTRPTDASVDAWLGWIIAVMHEASLAGTWQRLKSCHNHGCRWVFYDHSKNRGGNWCSMNVCGQRLKAKSYRRRRSR